MADIYTKPYFIPNYALIDLKGPKLAKVKAFLDQGEAKEQLWPSQGYYDYLQTFKHKGWAHALKPDLPVNTQLIQQSALEYVRSFFHPSAIIRVTHSAENWNRVMNTPEEAATFFDALLEFQEPIVLSQMFDVIKYCHSSNKNHKLFYTVAPAHKKVLQKLSKNVITIGEGTEHDLDLTDVKPKELNDELAEFFTASLKKV